MTDFVAGFIDASIHFCPYCAQPLDNVSMSDDTECSACGKPFCVIEGEKKKEESKNDR